MTKTQILQFVERVVQSPAVTIEENKLIAQLMTASKKEKHEIIDCGNCLLERLIFLKSFAQSN